MKILFATIRYFLIGAVVLLTLLLIATMVPIKGGIMVKIVKSGSMEPTIPTGSIVVIHPEPVYKVGDVVTFGKDTKTQIPTTHRIVAVTGSGASSVFQTKGDANDAPDQGNTRVADIEGKVIYHAPYVGFLLDFARKPAGFALLVGVPALAIIFDEILKIIVEVRRLRRQKRKQGSVASESLREAITTPPEPTIIRKVPGTDGIAVPQKKPLLPREHFLAEDQSKKSGGNTVKKTLTALFFIFGSVGVLASIGGTKAYFTDMEASIGNFLKAGVVTLTLSSDTDQAGRAQALRTSDASAPDSIPEKKAVGSNLFTIDVGKGDQSFPLEYTIMPKLDEGDPNGCKEMLIEAWIGETHFTGLLTDFNVPATTTMGHLQFLLTIPVPNTLTPGAACGGTLVFKARIAGASSLLGNAFSDTKEYRFEILNSAEETPPQAPNVEAVLDTTSDPGNAGGESASGEGGEAEKSSLPDPSLEESAPVDSGAEGTTQ